VYLQGAFELRNGVPQVSATNTASPDTIKAMPPEMTFDYLAVRLNGEKAAGKKIALNITFSDLKKNYALVVEHGVLNHAPRHVANADASLTLTKNTLDRIQLGELKPEQAVSSGELKLTGKRDAFTEFVGLLDTFPFWFNIVTR
jgi:alkyl sulfatase BDS1-like metallo-beta-lactamase superfamily hydrolase